MENAILELVVGVANFPPFEPWIERVVGLRLGFLFGLADPAFAFFFRAILRRVKARVRNRNDRFRFFKEIGNELIERSYLFRVFAGEVISFAKVLLKVEETVSVG